MKGYTFLEMMVTAPREKPLLVHLKPGTRIAGIVRDSEGKPIAGAEVSALGSGDAPSFETFSDAAGAFAFDFLSPGNYRIGAAAEGFARSFEEDVPAGKEDLTVVLRRMGTITGKVILEGEELPIENARVFAERLGGSGTAGWPSASTGRDGSFTLDGMAPGNYLIAARAEDLIPLGEPMEVALEDGGRIENQVVRVRQGIEVSGRVTDSSTGEPIPDARIDFDLAFYEKRPWTCPLFVMRAAKTGSDGTFILKGLKEGDYEFSFAAKGHLRKAEVAAASAGNELSFTLERGGSIAGRVVDAEGKPITGASAEIDPAVINSSIGTPRTKTDHEGRFFLDGLPYVETYLVIATFPGFSPSWEWAGPILPDEEVASIELRLPRERSKRGRILDENGNGIEGAAIVYQVGGEFLCIVPEEVRILSRYSYSLRSGEDGNFELLHLKEGDVYEVEASAEGFEPGREYSVPITDDRVPGGIDIYLRRIKPSLPSGTVAEDDPPARILGRLRAKDRDLPDQFKVKAIDHCGVKVHQESSGDHPPARFEIEIEKGTYIFQAEAPGFAPSRSREITVKAGEVREDVVIDLVPEATVEGQVVQSDPKNPVVRLAVSLRTATNFWTDHEAVTDKEGKFLVQGIPGGEFELKVGSRDWRWEVFRGYSIRAGERKKVLLKLGERPDPVGGIRGIILEGGSTAAEVFRRDDEWPKSFARVDIGTGLWDLEIGVDDDGRFEFRGMHPGDYWLSARGNYKDGGSFKTERRVTVKDDGRFAEVVIDLGGRVPVRGHVTTGGKPSEGLTIEAFDPWWEIDDDSPSREIVLSSGSSDSEGSYK